MKLIHIFLTVIIIGCFLTARYLIKKGRDDLAFGSVISGIVGLALLIGDIIINLLKD